MKEQERIEAALSALPDVHADEWEIAIDRGWGYWIAKYGKGEADKIRQASFVLENAAPDLAAEVLRLRAELAELRAELAVNDSVFQTTMRELAELKRWRDPVAEPPKCEKNKDETVGWLVYRPRAKSKKVMTTFNHPDWWKEYNGTSAEIALWIPLPEVGQ